MQRRPGEAGEGPALKKQKKKNHPNRETEGGAFTQKGQEPETG